jgi:hypothetical protein
LTGVSRTRRTLRASDLASVLNAIISLQPTGDSAEADTILRALEYKSTWPWTAEQIPAFAFGERTWGQLLASLIEHAPPLLDYYLQGATNDVDVGNALPNVIETTFNPPLFWSGWGRTAHQNVGTSLWTKSQQSETTAAVWNGHPFIPQGICHPRANPDCWRDTPR